MASRTCQVGVARSRLLGKADRNRYRNAVAVASGIWRPERAARLTRRSPEKSRNEPSSPICIAYLAFPIRIFLPAYPLPDAPVRIVDHSESATSVTTFVGRKGSVIKH
jgi:hypothetical protein